LDYELLMKAVIRHTDNKWVILWYRTMAKDSNAITRW
jgi:hypothetical protein